MTQLTKEEIEFVQWVLSHAQYTGIPDTLAQYLQNYAHVMRKLEDMKKPKDEQLPLEGVGV